MAVLGILYKFLIFPGFAFTAVLGGLASWFDRKITARLQWRVGPPFYQPFADIIKLLGKEIIIPEGAPPFIFVLSPLLGLAGVMLAASIIWSGNLDNGLTFVGDIIVTLYLLTLPSLSLIMGGFSSGSPFATIGASREMKLIMSYELPFIIGIFTVVAKARSIIFSGIISYQTSSGISITHPSCALAFVVCLFCVMAKLSLTPFDIAEAEQEIAAGPLVEYSGALLAVFKITKMLLYVALPLLITTLFLGGGNFGSISEGLGFAVKYLIILVIMVLVKNTNPRLRIDQALRFFWGAITALAALGFFLAVIGA